MPKRLSWIIWIVAFSAGTLTSLIVFQRELLRSGLVFLLIYAISLIFLGIPLISVLTSLGSQTDRNTYSPTTGFLLSWGAVLAALVLSYRLVYLGLSLHYLLGGLSQSPPDPIAYLLGQVLSLGQGPFSFSFPRPSLLIILAAASVLLYFISTKERFLPQVLFVLTGLGALLLLQKIVWAGTPYVVEEHLLQLEWSRLFDIRIWRTALTEALFSAGIYSGLFILLGIKMKIRRVQKLTLVFILIHVALAFTWAAALAQDLALVSRTFGLDLYSAAGQGILVPFAFVHYAVLLKGQTAAGTLFLTSVTALLAAGMTCLVWIIGQVLSRIFDIPYLTAVALTLLGSSLAASLVFVAGGGVYRIDILSQFIRAVAAPLVPVICIVLSMRGKSPYILLGPLLALLYLNIRRELALPYENYNLFSLILFGWFTGVGLPILLAVFASPIGSHHRKW